MKVKCLKSYKIYEDCRTHHILAKGREYDISEKLAEKLLKDGIIELCDNKEEPEEKKPRGRRRKSDKSPREDKSVK